jgi:hypothetical protein
MLSTKQLGLFFAIAWAISCALTLTLAKADNIYVERATGSGVSESDLETATELVKGAVPQVSADQVVEQLDQADFTLRPKLLHLGQAYILSVDRADKQGNVSFSTQLKAERIDELDKVAVRVTRSVLIGKVASQDSHVGEITNQEAHDGAQRRPTRNEWYVGFGGSNFSNMNVNGIGYSLGLAYGWDINTAMVRIMAEGSGLDSAFLLSMGLGADYFITTSDVAPYIGGDFGFGAAKAEGNSGFFSGDTIGGFDIGAEAGVRLLRSSSVNLDLGFRAGFLLHSNTYGNPAVYSLKLGLYF